MIMYSNLEVTLGDENIDIFLAYEALFISGSGRSKTTRSTKNSLL